MVQRRTEFRGGVHGGRAAPAWLAAITSSLLAVACFDTPPEYTVPTRIPPVLDTLFTAPPVTSVYAIDQTDIQVDFNIPFRSQDVGAQLQAVFVLDFDPAAPREIVGNLQTPAVRLDASDVPFEDQTNRNVTFQWFFDRTTIDPGCHTLTMIFSYTDNFAGFYTPADSSLVTTETWWFYFVPAGSDDFVVDCPLPTP